MFFKRKKYYLISYLYKGGFGNVFFMCRPYIDIKGAEKEITKMGEQAGEEIKGLTIITINKITKGQYDANN